MVRPVIFIAGCLMVLQGCSTTYPVFAKMDDGTGEFVGTARSTLVGESSFEMLGDDGTTCWGTYDPNVVMTQTQGTSNGGRINCSDGRVGTWAVAGSARGGQGFGMLDGKRFKIAYGELIRMSGF